MYKSLNTGTINVRTNGFEETLKLAKKYGYGSISYGVDNLAGEGIDRYQALDLMGQYGVMISDFALPVQITGQDVFNESFPRLESAARTAARLGIGRCTTWMLSFSNELEYAENFKWHTKMFRLIAEVLREYDIRFGVEFLGPQTLMNSGKYPFIHTIDKMLELCDAVGTGNVGLLLDAHHCYSSGLPGGEFARYIRSEKDIVLVHVNDDALGLPLDQIKDSPRYYPGEPGGGANDLRGFMSALKALKYTGPAAAEPFSAALNAMSDNDAIMKIVAESMAAVWPE